MSQSADEATGRPLDPSALRQLARPVTLLQARLRAMADDGWDINTLFLCDLEIQALADRASSERIIDLGNRLYQLHESLAACLQDGETPDEQRSDAIMRTLSTLNEYGTTPTDTQGPGDSKPAARRIRVLQLPEPELDLSGLPALSNVPHFVEPPPGFVPDSEVDAPGEDDAEIDAFRSDEDPAAEDTIATLASQIDTTPVDERPESTGDDDLDSLFEELGELTGIDEAETGVTGTVAPEPEAAPIEPAASPSEQIAELLAEDDDDATDLSGLFAEIEEEVGEVAPATPEPAPEEPTTPSPEPVIESPSLEVRPAPSGHRRSLYVLHGGEGSMTALRDLLAQDFEVQSFTDPEDFLEILNAIGPDGVIMDDAHLDRIDDVGPIIRKLRAKTHGPLSLVVFSTQQDVQARLRLMRAGADVFVSAALDTDEAARRIRDELQATPEDPYRILIVEDDRSQGIFAQSILNRAGMEAMIETDPLAVMPSMTSFEPDLILMDLHMPGCDGMELTAIIRERPEFIHTPIVFLSGEDDEDMQFDALLAGGDDFLSKPIRPRHLISAVKNRVRRARSAPKPSAAAAVEAPAIEEVATPAIVSREALDRELNAALEAARESDDDVRGGVIYVEVDRVYALRRRHGLPVLDELATAVEPHLLEAFPAPDRIAQYGDAAWCIYCPERDVSEMENDAQQLVRAIAAEAVELGGDTTRITASAGVCALSGDHENVARLVAVAERVCNRDADEDYGRVGVQRRVLATADGPLRDLGEEILRALDEDGFQMVYQPIVSLQGQEVDQYQCLLRLPRRGEEPLAPARVLAAAAELGMVNEIDRWALGKAIRILADRTSRDRPLQLFVNQSGEASEDGDFSSWLLDELDRRRVSGKAIVLEFKLHELARSLKSVVGLARTLSARRIRFCLGHFDGSETGFRILDFYRAEFVKVRPEVAFRQLREGLLSDTVDRLHELGAQAIVPGVEEAQLAVQLWSAGVDYIQGHFVQKPESNLSYNFAADH